MGQTTDANQTRNDLRHMFAIWGIDQLLKSRGER
jgi:hypothetical protein